MIRYNEIKIGDYAIFIGKGKAYIGEVSEIIINKTIILKEVDEFLIQNDEILQLNEIYPEYIARCKAAFHPFIHPFKINNKSILIPSLLNT